MKKNQKNRFAAFLCSTALAACAVPVGTAQVSAADAVVLNNAAGWFETAYAEWQPVSGASGYHVYADGNQVDSMLIRQYNGYYRADVPGLKAGNE